MKILCFSSRRRLPAIRLFIALVVAVLLVFSVGTAISASGEQESASEAVHDSAAVAEEAVEHAEGGAHGKGWVPTDTFRMLHFIVLAGGLFFLLKKPVSHALATRVKGIEAQLGDLENRKRKPNRNWPNTTRSSRSSKKSPKPSWPNMCGRERKPRSASSRRPNRRPKR